MTREQITGAAQGIIDLCKANNETCNIAEALQYLKGENEVYSIYKLLENFPPSDCAKIMYHFIVANIIENASMDTKLTYLYCNLKLKTIEARDKAVAFFEKHY